ncbi:unnamed protein product [Linum trigynum]|uniref:Uncharacterized protein n=1 Tax=Linum trigynum TaxID=586398 RepID=A0AAV2E1K0_9ROSI
MIYQSLPSTNGFTAALPLLSGTKLEYPQAPCVSPTLRHPSAARLWFSMKSSCPPISPYLLSTLLAGLHSLHVVMVVVGGQLHILPRVSSLDALLVSPPASITSSMGNHSQ